MTTLTEQLANVREAIAELGDGEGDELRVRVFEEWRQRDCLVAATGLVGRETVLHGLRAMERELVALVAQEVTA